MERSQILCAVHETLTAGLIVKHNVCLWSLRCQSSALTNTLLLLNPHCALLNVFVCECVLQCEGARAVCESKKKTSVKMSLPLFSSPCQPLVTQCKDKQCFMGLKLSASLPQGWNSWWCLCIRQNKAKQTQTQWHLNFSPAEKICVHICYLSKRMCPVLCRLSW